MKSLSEILDEIEPSLQGTAPVDEGRNAVEIVDRASYDRMKRVAIILAAALVCNETFHSLGGIDDCEPCEAIKRAKEIIGEGK